MKISTKERKILEKLLALTHSGKLEWKERCDGFGVYTKFFSATFYYNFLTIVYAPGIGSSLSYDARQVELANDILLYLQKQQRKQRLRRINHECDLTLIRIAQFEQQQEISHED